MRRSPFAYLLPLLAAAMGLHAGVSEVTLSGDEFRVNGVPTLAGALWQGHRIQGQLIGIHGSQAAFDERDPAAAARWAYKDTGRWDADRNSREFAEAIPEWRRHGISAVRVGIQSGPTGFETPESPSGNGGFQADGSPDPDTFRRLGSILDAADAAGRVVVLTLFEPAQERRLADEAAVLKAVDGTVDWIREHAWRHVILEVHAAASTATAHPVLHPDRIHEVVERVRKNRKDSKRFLVGTGIQAGSLPSTNVVKASDFLSIRPSTTEPAEVARMIRETRKLPGYHKMPVLVTGSGVNPVGQPGSWSTATLETALAMDAGWFLADPRRPGEGPESGFQTPPVDWAATSPRKRALLRRVAEITGNRIDGAEYPATTARWWRGNVHTHSLWSDGDDYPEMIAAWYKRQGYHFLGLTDHNLFQEGQRWIQVPTNRTGVEALRKYREAFGNWVEERNVGEVRQVRLKPLAEYRPLVEEPGRFLLVPSEEITGGYLSRPVHINGVNLREPVEPKGGSNVTEVMQRVVDAVRIQRGKTGQPMFTQINHPNFGWGITAEDLMKVDGLAFFEIYNGHPTVHNLGDAEHAGMERVWDLVLAFRLGVHRLPPVYGLAVDDSHAYHKLGKDQSNAGRGWIQVRSGILTPESVVEGLERGRFYSSTGVELEDIQRDGARLSLRIRPKPGVTYTTRFIGTRRGFPTDSSPVPGLKGDPSKVTRRYSDAIGEVLAEVGGTSVGYTFRGDELYVRARIDSSRSMENPVDKDEKERAWIQPVVP